MDVMSRITAVSAPKTTATLTILQKLVGGLKILKFINSVGEL